jgi:hypothetical protein
VRYADAITITGMPGAGARAWSAAAISVNPSAMRGACDGFQVTLTHKANVRPLGLPGGSSG